MDHMFKLFDNMFKSLRIEDGQQPYVFDYSDQPSLYHRKDDSESESSPRDEVLKKPDSDGDNQPFHEFFHFDFGGFPSFGSFGKPHQFLEDKADSDLDDKLESSGDLDKILSHSED